LGETEGENLSVLSGYNNIKGMTITINIYFTLQNVEIPIAEVKG
jgi:hypothetical protein